MIVAQSGPLVKSGPGLARRRGERHESWWNFCTEERKWRRPRETRTRNRSPAMSSARLSPEKEAEIEGLAEEIRQTIDAEIEEMAANLATTDDAHLFGANEFKLRAIALKIAAK